MTSKILSTFAFALFSVKNTFSQNNETAGLSSLDLEPYLKADYYDGSREGLAQLIYQGTKYSICVDTADEYTQAKKIGDTFCKRLGYNGDISQKKVTYVYTSSVTWYNVNSEQGLSPNSITCSSTSDIINDCSVSLSYKTCTNGLHLTCSSTDYEPPSCTTNDLELVGTAIDFELSGTLSSCKSKCVLNGNCNYLSYGKLQGNTNNICRIYNTYTSKTYNTNAQTVSYPYCVSGVAPTPSPTLAPTPTPPCETDNLELYGTYNLFVGKTFSECKIQCESDSNCNYLSFAPESGLNSNRCYLYNTYAGKYSNTEYKTVSYTGNCVSLPTPSPTPSPTIPTTTTAPTTTIAPTTTTLAPTPHPTTPPASSSSRNTINYQLIMSLLFIVLLL